MEFSYYLQVKADKNRRENYVLNDLKIVYVNQWM